MQVIKTSETLMKTPVASESAPEIVALEKLVSETYKQVGSAPGSWQRALAGRRRAGPSPGLQQPPRGSCDAADSCHVSRGRWRVDVWGGRGWRVVGAPAGSPGWRGGCC